jgi:hypothetical protein
LATPTAQHIISASVELYPDADQIGLGGMLTVRAFVRDESVGCTFTPQLLQLEQQGLDAPVFTYASPQTVSPPASPTLFLLRAVRVGTVVLKGSAYGEVRCETTNGWWTNGNSGPISVQHGQYKVYLPLKVKR